MSEMDTDVSWFRRPSADQPGTMNAAFELLDRRIVAGGADDPVLLTDGAPVSCARLLEDVAALGGVLRAQSVGPGTPVAWRAAADRDGITALLALVRVGGRLDPAADLAVDESGIGEVPWDLALQAGRTDPAPAAELDPGATWHGEVTVRDLAIALRRLPTPCGPADLLSVLSASTIDR